MKFVHKYLQFVEHTHNIHEIIDGIFVFYAIKKVSKFLRNNSQNGILVYYTTVN